MTVQKAITGFCVWLLLEMDFRSLIFPLCDIMKREHFKSNFILSLMSTDYAGMRIIMCIVHTQRIGNLRYS